MPPGLFDYSPPFRTAENTGACLRPIGAKSVAVYHPHHPSHPCHVFLYRCSKHWLCVMSANPPTQPTLPASRNRNSFLSKFRSPLGQRNRGITDFYIDPDDPWRSYFPGDVIKGTVVVTVVRPVRITHIVVCLHGYVKVFKNAIPAGETTPDLGFLGPGRGRRGAEYMGNGLATLFEDELVLCGDGRLKEGIYKFRFEMGLPPYALPSSINVRLLMRPLILKYANQMGNCSLNVELSATRLPLPLPDRLP